MAKFKSDTERILEAYRITEQRSSNSAKSIATHLNVAIETDGPACFASWTQSAMLAISVLNVKVGESSLYD